MLPNKGKPAPSPRGALAIIVLSVRLRTTSLLSLRCRSVIGALYTIEITSLPMPPAPRRELPPCSLGAFNIVLNAFGKLRQTSCLPPRGRVSSSPSVGRGGSCPESAEKIPRIAGDFKLLVEAGGFGPPKRNATDLQSAHFGHSGTLPFFQPLLLECKMELVDGLEPPTC